MKTELMDIKAVADRILNKCREEAEDLGTHYRLGIDVPPADGCGAIRKCGGQKYAIAAGKVEHALAFHIGKADDRIGHGC